MTDKPTYEELEQKLIHMQSALEQSVQQEEKIRQSRDQIRFISDNFPAYMAYVGADDLVYKFVNHQFEVAFNRPRDQIIGQHIVHIIGESNYNFALKYIETVRSGKATSYENVFNLTQGKRWIKVNYTPDFDQHGKVVGIVVLSYDVSEQKNAEESLLKTKARLVEAQQLAKMGWWEYNIADNRITWSDEVYDIYGVPRDKDPLTIENLMELIQPEYHDYHQQQFDLILQTGVAEFEYPIDLPDGHSRWIWARGELKSDDSGNPMLIHGVVQDITERKRIEAEKSDLESQLFQSRKLEAIGTLAGGIAHDFNNLIGIITGYVSIAMTDLDKNDKLYEILTAVQMGASQAQNLTQQLLTFSRGGKPIKKAANLNHLIEDAAGFVTRGSKSKCIFEPADNLWTIEVDAGQFNQVIGNLVINANQAMPNGGIIKISTENVFIEKQTNLPLPQGRYIKIAVEDQGVGISEKHLPNIFDPYFTTKQQGSGLGLATSYSIIKKHDGHITVESKLEVGTTFNIFLPVSDKYPDQAKETKALKHHGHGRILIMDDQQQILDMVGMMLKSMGYETEQALDGAQAIEKYRTALQTGHAFDLVILDLTVPGGMGGARTISELLKIDPNIKAVVSSGYSNDPIMSNYKDYGFWAVIPKPYTIKQMGLLLDMVFKE